MSFCVWSLSFQVVSHGHCGRRFNQVNYEDPNFNIEIPFFTIHGNHDDPAGSGGLSALDLVNMPQTFGAEI